MLKVFNSLVNKVGLVCLSDGVAIQKEYSEIARGTGIPVPQRRSFIERNVLNQLKKYTSLKFKVPELIDASYLPSKIYLEFIDGEKIGPSSIISPSLFREFGEWLSVVEKKLFDFKEDIFRDVWEVQLEVSNILRAYKGGIIPNGYEGYFGVSLGDVGVENLIRIKESETLFLLDFEFCHISVLGRDVGQLAAQMEVLGFNQKYINELLVGYSQSDLHKELACKWKDIFKKYYLRKYRGEDDGGVI